MVPSGWSRRKITEILERVAKPVSPQENTKYREIGIRSHGKGIFHKDPVTSLDLGNKRVFEVIPNSFVVNIVFAWEQAVAKTTENEIGFIASHRFPQFQPKNNSCDIDYLLYLFKTSKGKHLLGLASPGGAGRNKTLGQKEFEKLELLLPNTKEQRKIAQILNTWDKAISTTESLIANSQQQKKYLMQQLLTGKKRFAGFETKWKEVKFNNIIVSTQLGTTERHKDESLTHGIPLLKMGNLTWGGFSLSSLEVLPKNKCEESLLLKKGDFLFNTRNTPKLVGKSAVWKGQLTKATFDNNINKIIFVETIDPDFICVFLTTGKGKSLISSLSAGSTSVAAIYWKDLKNLRLKIPLLPEQQKIASVLLAANQEINTLQQKLTHLKQEKKALMQQLLTGKRRVKVDNETEAA